MPSLSEISQLLPSAGPGNVEPMTGVGQGPLGAGGGLGGFMMAQREAIAQQQLGQLQQDQSLATQGNALTLQQRQADENTFGQSSRDIQGAANKSQLDLWHNGILGDVDKTKAIASMTAAEQATMTSNLQKTLMRGQAAESIQEALPRDANGQSLGIPPAMMSEVKKHYKSITGEDLPDDPMEAAAKVQHLSDMSKTSAPRITMMLDQFNKLGQIKEENKGKETTANIAAGASIGGANIGAQAQRDVAQTNYEGGASPARVLAQVQNKALTADPKNPLTAGELALLSTANMQAGNAALGQSKIMQLNMLQAVAGNKEMSVDDKNKMIVQMTNQFRKDTTGSMGTFLQNQQDVLDSRDNAPAAAVAPVAKGSDPSTWTDRTKKYTDANGATYAWQSNPPGWKKQ